MDIFEVFSSLEENSELHMSRLMILMGVFAGKKGQGEIKGLTKLAKLDFLLRYPVYLEKALEKRGVDKTKVDVEDYERQSVKSRMTRYKFGPWDFRYRKFLNILVGKGFAKIAIDGRTIIIGLTDKGIEYAKFCRKKMNLNKLHNEQNY